MAQHQIHPATSAPEQVHDAIVDALADWQVRRVLIAGSGLPPTGTTVNDLSPRFTFGIRGVRHVLLDRGEARLRRGDVLVVPRGGWSRPYAQAPHIAISIDCYDEYTRYAYMHRAPEKEAPAQLAYHSARPLGSVARSLVEAIESLAHESDGAKRIAPLLVPTFREVLRGCRREADKATSLGDWRRAQSWILEHGGEDLARDRIATAAAMHPNHLSRLCRRHTGRSLADYLTGIRMARARHALRTTVHSIATVAELAGYRDVTHFRKRFKRVHGLTPDMYRQSQRS